MSHYWEHGDGSCASEAQEPSPCSQMNFLLKNRFSKLLEWKLYRGKENSVNKRRTQMAQKTKSSLSRRKFIQNSGYVAGGIIGGGLLGGLGGIVGRDIFGKKTATTATTQTKTVADESYN